MGSYRRSLDIIADILDVVNGDAKKTQIMYKANLSYAVMQKYLAQLTRSCLISYKTEKRCYILTNKGEKFLENYREYFKTNEYAKKRLNEARVKKKALERLCTGA